MRETIARVLRSYGLSRGEQPERAGSTSDFSPGALTIIDADFDPGSWEPGEWQSLEATGIRGVVMSRIPEGDISLSPEKAHLPAYRAIIDAPEDADRQTFQRLHDQGACGARFTLRNALDREAMLRCADQLVTFGWHAEIELPAGDDAEALHRAEWDLLRMPVPLCFSGLAGFLNNPATRNSAAALLLEFVQMGRFWLKLSGSDLASAPEPVRDAACALTRAAMTIREDRLVWGSGPMPASRCDHLAAGLQTLLRWFPDRAQQGRILSSNPAALYGF